MRIERFQIENTQPSPEKGEMTDKGYINQAAVLGVRQDSVEGLYIDDRYRTSPGAGSDR